MTQVKIYGLREQLQPIRSRLSDTIHSCVVEALSFPADKRAHRFFHLDPDDFFAPSGRTVGKASRNENRYTIIEFSMIEGRLPTVGYANDRNEEATHQFTVPANRG
jgi:hypothetical protein